MAFVKCQEIDDPGLRVKSDKDLFGVEDKKEDEYRKTKEMAEFDEEILPITTDHYLSETPFRAIASGEFIYEDASLRYVGIDKHEGQNIGLYHRVA